MPQKQIKVGRKFSTIFNATETDVILAGDSEVFLCVLALKRILLRTGTTDINFLIFKYFLVFFITFSCFSAPGTAPGTASPSEVWVRGSRKPGSQIFHIFLPWVPEARARCAG